MACAGAWGQDTAPSFPANGANYRLFPADQPPLVPKPQQLHWTGKAIRVQSVRILAPSPSRTSYPEQMKFIVSELKSFLADHRVKVAPDGAFAVKFVKGEVKAGTENPKLKEEAYSLRVTPGRRADYGGGHQGVLLRHEDAGAASSAPRRDDDHRRLRYRGLAGF